MSGARQAPVFWFTGLSGAGKSTVAGHVLHALRRDGQRVLTLDGDDVRDRLHQHLGFSAAEIQENNRLITGLCLDRRAEHDAIFVPIISPYRESRREARSRIGAGFYEIYFHADIETVIARDTKGLYARARDGEIDNMIGFSPGSPYEPPLAADLILDTRVQSEEESSAVLLEFARQCIDGSGAARHAGHF